MAESPTEAVAGAADDLFDRYLLPKVALSVILVASLVGTALTAHLSGGAPAGAVLARWSFLVALGVLSGGLLWKHGFVRPADLDAGAATYCERMDDRFDRIAAAALVVLLASGTAVLPGYERALGPTPAVAALAVSLAGLALAVGTSVVRERSVGDGFRSAPGLAALVLAVTAVVLTGTLEVAVRGGGPAATAVRAAHLLAFAGWVGGAVWNIFVAVPTGQHHRTVPVVEAAGQQLERFRWAVRFIIPLLVLTGLYQAVDALGVGTGAYTGSVPGVAVLAKLGFVGVLVVIFRLCPMWRACSPIDGICDLEALDADQGPTPEGSSDD